MRTLFALVTAAALSGPAAAAVKTQTIEYKHGDASLKGYLAFDDSKTGKRPGVLVFHEWWGLNEYAKKRAEMLAELGYVAFCADMFGDGKTTDHPMDAQKFAGEVRKNIDTWLGRATAALKVLTDRPEVDAGKIGAIGYCFGGSTALQLALTGADVKAVAAFHAGLPPVDAETAKKVKGSILLAQGGADAAIPEAANKKFTETLTNAGAKVQLEMYPGATHSYTVEGIEKRMPTLKYDPAADKKSWEQMQALFQQAFGG